MNSSIIIHVDKEIKTNCNILEQSINWNVGEISGSDYSFGFIVQELKFTDIFDDFIRRYSYYFEAWKVMNGACVKEERQYCDDRFSIGTPYDLVSGYQECIGHFGYTEFLPRAIYWVQKGTPLYAYVCQWSENVVDLANGLKSVYASPSVRVHFENIKSYQRKPFSNKWDLRDSNTVYNTILDYCKKQWPNSQDKKDRKNFYLYIDEMFSRYGEDYNPIKRKIISTWEGKYNETRNT